MYIYIYMYVPCNPYSMGSRAELLRVFQPSLLLAYLNNPNHLSSKILHGYSWITIDIPRICRISW